MYILYILYDVTNGYATHGYQLKTLIEQESKKQKQKKYKPSKTLKITLKTTSKLLQKLKKLF